ncbi:MAG: response regulator [Pirellulales bacterium]
MPTISLVDDDLSVRKALCRLMAVAGYGAVAYESAEAFLAAGAAETSDCVILDVHLPSKSGLELQAELVALRVRRPIVFITAFDDESARAQALQAGAFEFLRKPLDTKRLLEVIKAALAADGAGSTTAAGLEA